MSQSKRYAPARQVRRRYPEAICRTGLTGFSVLVGHGHAQVLATGKSRGMAWRSAASNAAASTIKPARSSEQATSKEILIGEDQLRKLEAVAEAASDLKLAHGDAEFARLNGGTKKLLRDLCAKVSDWESFMSSISGD